MAKFRYARKGASVTGESAAKQLGADLTKWSKKKPKHPGVYNASLFRDPTMWRYWNGTQYSRSQVTPEDAYAAGMAKDFIGADRIVFFRGLTKKIELPR